jgi:hypothetical protein
MSLCRSIMMQFSIRKEKRNGILPVGSPPDGCREDRLRVDLIVSSKVERALGIPALRLAQHIRPSAFTGGHHQPMTSALGKRIFAWSITSRTSFGMFVIIYAIFLRFFDWSEDRKLSARLGFPIHHQLRPFQSIKRLRMCLVVESNVIGSLNVLANKLPYLDKTRKILYQTHQQKTRFSLQKLYKSFKIPLFLTNILRLRLRIKKIG